MNYATLEVALTKFTKTNKSFSIGRARVFYVGANQNRTIISEDIAEQMIKTIPGTPIIGEFDGAKGDFQGHGPNQVAYGFVPLEPHATKVTVVEDSMGIPVKRSYYEVDVVIWDGRFPEAAKILGEEKSLSMELNPESVQGEFEVYENKHYLRFTNAEFIGITVLGNEHTPCFKDAKFLSLYSSMLNEYSLYSTEQQSENNIGGTDMSIIEEVASEISEIVESVTDEATIINEGAETIVEETVVAEPQTIEAEVAQVAEEVTTVEEAVVTEEVAPQVEAEEFEVKVEIKVKDSAECATEEEPYMEEPEMEQPMEESLVELPVEVSGETIPVIVETEDLTEGPEDASEVEALKQMVDALNAKIEDLKAQLGIYEKSAKVELLDTFSKKIANADLIKELSNKIDTYSVEELKATLGQELANQVLAEETKKESLPGVNYSFSGLVKSSKSADWTQLVRNRKNKNN